MNFPLLRHIVSRVLRRYSRSKKVNLVMLGLDGSGKTTLLYKLKFGETYAVPSTKSYNVEAIGYRHINFNLWDFGGQESIRPLWSFYARSARAIMYVVDCSDVESIDMAKEELHKLLDDPSLSKCSFLIYANKQDVPDSVTDVELKHLLSLAHYSNRNWSIQPCCALTGEGLYEGLDHIYLMSRLHEFHQ